MVVRNPHRWTPDPFERSWRWELTHEGFVLHLEQPPHRVARWDTVHERGRPVLSTPLEAAHDLGAVVCVHCAMIAFTYQDMAWTG